MNRTIKEDIELAVRVSNREFITHIVPCSISAVQSSGRWWSISLDDTITEKCIAIRSFSNGRDALTAIWMLCKVSLYYNTQTGK